MLLNCDADTLTRAAHLDRARTLLAEALAIVDQHANAPEVGARLQTVIETLDDPLPGSSASFT